MGFAVAGKKKITAEYAKHYRKYAVFILNREGKKQLRLLGGKYVNAEITSSHAGKGCTKNTTIRKLPRLS